MPECLRISHLADGVFDHLSASRNNNTFTISKRPRVELGVTKPSVLVYRDTEIPNPRIPILPGTVIVKIILNDGYSLNVTVGLAVNWKDAKHTH